MIELHDSKTSDPSHIWYEDYSRGVLHTACEKCGWYRSAALDWHCPDFRFPLPTEALLLSEDYMGHFVTQLALDHPLRLQILRRRQALLKLRDQAAHT